MPPHRLSPGLHLPPFPDIRAPLARRRLARDAAVHYASHYGLGEQIAEAALHGAFSNIGRAIRGAVQDEASAAFTEAIVRYSASAASPEVARAFAQNASSLSRCLVYGKPYENVVGQSAIEAWARRHRLHANRGFDFYPPALEGDANLPIWAPMLKPPLGQDIYALGTVPEQAYRRVTFWTPNQRGPFQGLDNQRELSGAAVSLRCTDREWRGNMWSEDPDPGCGRVKLGSGYHASTWWWGFDSQGTAITCVHSMDLFLEDRDFRAVAEPRPGYYRALRRGCYPSKDFESAGGVQRAFARRIRPSILVEAAMHARSRADQDNGKVLQSFVVALPGNYPPPPPKNLVSSENALLAAHREGRVKCIGAGLFGASTRMGWGVSKPWTFTGLRIWPVRVPRGAATTGRDWEAWVFYYRGQQVLAACPLDLYRVLAEVPSSSDAEFCAPSQRGEPWEMRLMGGVFDMFTSGITGGIPVARLMHATASAVARGKGVSAARNIASSLLTPALAGALGDAAVPAVSFFKDTLLATGIPEFGAAHFRGLAQLPSGLQDIVGQALGTSSGLQKFLGGGFADLQRRAPWIRPLIESAASRGVPTDAFAKVVGTQTQHLREITGRLYNEGPAMWTRLATAYMTDVRKDTGEVFSGENAFATLTAIQAGGEAPGTSDPSVLASALQSERDDRRSELDIGKAPFLESSAFEYAKRCAGMSPDIETDIPDDPVAPSSGAPAAVIGAAAVAAWLLLG